MKWMMASQMSTNSLCKKQCRFRVPDKHLGKSTVTVSIHLILLSINQTLRRKNNSSLGAHWSHWETGTRWKSVPDNKKVGWLIHGASKYHRPSWEFVKGQEAYTCHNTYVNQPKSHNKTPSLSSCKLHIWDS